MTPDILRTWKFTFGEDLTAKRRSPRGDVRVKCPFHGDATPSCDVNLDRNVFFCRSCGAKGGALDVLVRAGVAMNRREAASLLS